MFTAADFEVPKPRDPKRPCGKCQRTGIFEPYGVCFGCGGEGCNLSTRDRKRMQEVADRRHAQREALDRRARERGGIHLYCDARDGLLTLEGLEPHRVTKLFASVANGRVDDVIDALVAYWVENRHRLAGDQKD